MKGKSVTIPVFWFYKSAVKIFTLSILVLWLTSGCDRGNPKAQLLSDAEIAEVINRNFENGKRENAYSQNLQYRLLSGFDETLESNQGKIVLINFWATWCYPCKVEMPDLEDVHQSLGNERFRLLTVNHGESREKVEKFIEKSGYTFDVVLDHHNTISQFFSITGLPTTILIDKDGTILGRAMGVREWNGTELVTLFESLVHK